MPNGELTVIGIGIKFGGHLTPEARGCIGRADRVIHGLADEVSKAWLASIVDDAVSFTYYEPGRPRRETYERWVEQLLAPLREGLTVCAVFYGHPGVYVYASHEAVRRARAEGYAARMLPGISAEDCLIADLGVDPAHHGWVSYEATDFLIRRRAFDPHSALVLWQVGLAGRLDYDGTDDDVPGLPLLRETLEEVYGPDHEVILYEAAQFAIFPPLIRPSPLHELKADDVTAYTTLYVPPLEEAPIDEERVRRLGLSMEDVVRTRNVLRRATALDPSTDELKIS